MTRLIHDSGIEFLKIEKPLNESPAIFMGINKGLSIFVNQSVIKTLGGKYKTTEVFFKCPLTINGS